MILLTSKDSSHNMLYFSGEDDMNKTTEKPRLSIVRCPHCGKNVQVIPFGERFLAVCCNMIIYVSNYPFTVADIPPYTAEQPDR